MTVKTITKSSARVELVDLAVLAGPERDRWDGLFAAQAKLTAGLANPFTAPEWVETWYHHFTRPTDRHLLAVRRGQELVGVAPFFAEDIDKKRVRLASRLQLVGAGQGGSLLELPQVLAAPGQEREVLRAVVAATMERTPHGREVDWTEIAIPTAQGWFEPEWSYSTGEPAAFFRPHLARACVVLPLRDGWDATKATLKRNLKESLRRSRNRLAKDGRPWTVTTLTDGIDAAAVDRFLDLHRRRSQLESGVHHGDAYADAGRRAFLRDLLPRLGAKGRASLLELHLGGELVAVQLALHAPGVAYLHSSGVDPEAWSLGPVTFLQERVVREAAERGDRWVNFSPGPNVTKLRWSERFDVHQDFAYGSGGPALRRRYSAFAVGQAWTQAGHGFVMAGSHEAPARAENRQEVPMTTPRRDPATPSAHAQAVAKGVAPVRMASVGSVTDVPQRAGS